MNKNFETNKTELEDEITRLGLSHKHLQNTEKEIVDSRSTLKIAKRLKK